MAAARAGIGIVGPVSAGVATGHPVPGLFGSIGALGGTIADRGGPYRIRALRVIIGVTCGATGLFIGSAARGHGLVVLGVLVGVALVSALGSAIGSVASISGLLFVIFASVGSGLSVGAPLWLPPVAYLAGGVWVLTLTLSAWPYGRRTPERLAVAEVYRKLAGLLGAVGQSWVVHAREELTTALNDAYDAVLSFRTRTAGRDPEVRRLVALLGDATQVIEATVTLIREEKLLPREVPRALMDVADAIQSGGPPPRLPNLDTRSPGMRTLGPGLEAITALISDGKPGEEPGTPNRRSVRERARGLWERVSSGPRTLQWAFRLALCVAIAESLPFVAPIDRSYWVVLTVAVVLKPDFGSVFARAIQRGLGTVVGVLLGAAVLAILPHGPAVLVFVAAFAAMIPVGRQRNYGMLSTFISPVIVLLLDLLAGGGWQLVQTRILDTLLGCGIVLIFGYLLWPGTWRTAIGQNFTETVDAVSAYLRRALGPEPAGRSDLRRDTYRQLADLRTVFQRALSEPAPTRRQASAWWPAIVALDRVMDAVTASVLHAQHGGARPDPASVEALGQALDDLSSSIRVGRGPRELRLPDDESLAGVTAEVHMVRSVFSGPPLEECSPRAQST